MGGRMPRPARVEEHRACQGDEIGVARGDDGFGLFELGDEADGDDRERVAALIERASGTW